jgi:uncharacterized protein with HEPN domain
MPEKALLIETLTQILGATVTHHYFDLNAEAVFDVCKHDMDTLKETVEQMLRDVMK